MILRLSVLFWVIFIIGYFLSLYLYKSRGKVFRKSALQLKIVMWVPIFALFLIFIAGGITARIIIVLFVLAGVSRDFYNQFRQSKHKYLITAYTSTVVIGILSFVPLALNNKTIAIAVCFGSVMSDVLAFFMGNFVGKHHLPAILNKNKSWEGVFGQFLGAFAGIVLVNYFVVSVPISLFIVVGIGSALGDLTNSYVKRQENIKDWGNSIAGHGGFLDRFSSLSYAGLLSLIFMFFA